MSGIHKSREVYKYTPTRDGRKLVPVRGLYVSGLHTEPRYMDHWLEVVGYTSNDGDIVDYIETNIDKYANAFSFVGIETYQPEVIEYSTTNINLRASGFAICGVDTQNVAIIPYNTQSQSVYPTGYAITHFDHDPPTIINYQHLFVDSSLEHILTIVDYTSSEFTITDTT